MSVKGVSSVPSRIAESSKSNENLQSVVSLPEPEIKEEKLQLPPPTEMSANFFGSLNPAEKQNKESSEVGIFEEESSNDELLISGVQIS